MRAQVKTLDKKAFGTLFFSIFAAVTGVGIVVPLLPVYAHQMGASGLYVGLIFAAFSFSRTILLPYFGALSDRRGRKPFIVAGLLGYALVSFAFMLAPGIGSLVFLRLVQGMASAMIMPVAQAYVGDLTPPGQEGFTMGLFNVSTFFGLSIGPVLGGIINDRFSLDAAFAVMGLLTLVGVFLSQTWLPPRAAELPVGGRQEPIGLGAMFRQREMSALFIFRWVYAACIGIIWGFLPVLADTILQLSSSATGILVMLGVFVSGILQPPLGYLADRLNRTMMVITGSLIVAFAMLWFGFARGFWDLFAANLFFGLGGGIAMPALMALVVDQGKRLDAMGSVMGFMTTAHSAGMLAGALLAGAMMDAFELRQAFGLGVVLMLAGLGAFVVLRHPRSRT